MKLKNQEKPYLIKWERKIQKTEFPDKWKILTKKLAYHYECFNSIGDYEKPVNNLQKQDFFRK